MTGLEGILKKIEEDAKVASAAVLADANKKAEQILTAALEEGEQVSIGILEKAGQEAQELMRRAESSAHLHEKKLILDAKQSMISHVIGKARGKLMELPADEYFEIIIKMIKRYALSGPGKIIFSNADLQRLPLAFEKALQETLQSVGMLEVSDAAGDFEGGFVLVYGDVEVNCTFDALFSSDIDSLRDKVNVVLFRQ